MDMVQLRERVARQFPNVEQIGDSVVRFIRTAADQPFAVYYLDIADELPDSVQQSAADLCHQARFRQMVHDAIASALADTQLAGC